jgi:hypothetical protein
MSQLLTPYFSQADNIQLQRLQTGMSNIDLASQNGEITPREAQELRRQAEEALGPLQQRQKQHQQYQQSQQFDQLATLDKFKQVREMENRQVQAGALQTHQAVIFDPIVHAEMLARLQQEHPQLGPQQLNGLAMSETARRGGVKHMLQTKPGEFTPVEYPSSVDEEDTADQDRTGMVPGSVIQGERGGIGQQGVEGAAGPDAQPQQPEPGQRPPVGWTLDPVTGQWGPTPRAKLESAWGGPMGDLPGAQPMAGAVPPDQMRPPVQGEGAMGGSGAHPFEPLEGTRPAPQQPVEQPQSGAAEDTGTPDNPYGYAQPAEATGPRDNPYSFQPPPHVTINGVQHPLDQNGYAWVDGRVYNAQGRMLPRDEQGRHVDSPVHGPDSFDNFDQGILVNRGGLGTGFLPFGGSSQSGVYRNQAAYQESLLDPTGTAPRIRYHPGMLDAAMERAALLHPNDPRMQRRAAEAEVEELGGATIQHIHTPASGSHPATYFPPEPYTTGGAGAGGGRGAAGRSQHDEQELLRHFISEVYKDINVKPADRQAQVRERMALYHSMHSGTPQDARPRHVDIFTGSGGTMAPGLTQEQQDLAHVFSRSGNLVHQLHQSGDNTTAHNLETLRQRALRLFQAHGSLRAMPQRLQTEYTRILAEMDAIQHRPAPRQIMPGG